MYIYIYKHISTHMQQNLTSQTHDMPRNLCRYCKIEPRYRQLCVRLKLSTHTHVHILTIRFGYTVTSTTKRVHHIPYTYVYVCIYISEESMQGKAPTYAKPPRIEKRDGCRQREARERGERVRERERHYSREGKELERGKS